MQKLSDAGVKLLEVNVQLLENYAFELAAKPLQEPLVIGYEKDIQEDWDLPEYAETDSNGNISIQGMSVKDLAQAMANLGNSDEAKTYFAERLNDNETFAKVMQQHTSIMSVISMIEAMFLKGQEKKDEV